MKKFILCILWLFASTFSLTTVAAPITVSKSITVDVDIKKIWRWTGGFCTIRVWHPVVKQCDVIKEGNIEFRILTLKDGGQIKEKYTGGQVYGYSYMITESPLPVKDYHATFQAEQLGDKVKFTWSANFLAKGVTDAEAENVITGIFGGGLQSIKERYMQRKKKHAEKK